MRVELKKAERRRIDTFELWHWRRLLRVFRTARRSNQSILKEISPEYSWEGLMLKLNLQYFGHLMQRTESLEKTLMLGKIEGWKKKGPQRMRWLDGITNSMDMCWVSSRSWWWTGNPCVLQSMRSQNWTWLSVIVQKKLITSQPKSITKNNKGNFLVIKQLIVKIQRLIIYRHK